MTALPAAVIDGIGQVLHADHPHVAANVEPYDYTAPDALVKHCCVCRQPLSRRPEPTPRPSAKVDRLGRGGRYGGPCG